MHTQQNTTPATKSLHKAVVAQHTEHPSTTVVNLMLSTGGSFVEQGKGSSAAAAVVEDAYKREQYERVLRKRQARHRKGNFKSAEANSAPQSNEKVTMMSFVSSTSKTTPHVQPPVLEKPASTLEQQ